MRLLELQNEQDSLQTCTLIGRSVPDANLRGWAALVPAEALTIAEGLRQSGLTVLRGKRASLALGSIAQIWSAARSIADGLELEAARASARLLMERAAHVESPQPGSGWRLPRSALSKGRTLIMGVVNATPDSFSDGGAYDPLQRALELAEQGADIIDIGGESTRPGAPAVSAADERARTEPVIRQLAERGRTPISIDTTKSDVAKAALDAGAEIVNDISGLQRDPALAQAARGASFALMHMRGTPADMLEKAVYADLHGEILAELEQALQRAAEAGIPKDQIALDPGLGFSKNGGQNLLLMRRLRELTQLGHPLLVGASRKSFIGKATGKTPPERVYGSVAAAAILAMQGAAIVRVHDVAATRDALAVADAVRTSSG